MNKCIVCECANILYYEPPKERPPKTCPNCGRDTRNYASMREEDPRIGILVEKYRSRLGKSDGKSGLNVEEDSQEEKRYEKQEIHNNPYTYNLISKDGKITISIPQEGGIIGRTAIGGEQLAHNGKVSREHLRLTPAKRAQGVMAEDISANGTLVDGRRLIKNREEFVVIDSEITMGGEVFVLKRESVK